MKKNNILSSKRLEELKKKKRKILRNKILFFVFIFLVFFIGLAFLSRWQNLNINTVVVSGNKVIDTKSIEEIANQNIKGHYLWLFPKSNFIIYPQHKIEKELKNKFKRIKSLSVNEKNIKTLEISVSEYEGKYLWCGYTIPELNNNSSQKCYFSDSDGYIFDEAPYFSGNVYFKFYGKTSSNTEDPSGYYFMTDNFKKIISFKETLEKMNLKLSAFFEEDNGDMNIYLYSDSTNLSSGPKIIFRKDADFEKIAENLQAALTTEPLLSDFKNKYSSLLYIDLRFGNKVYYKFGETKQ
ncbi:MAG: FtsQ-type POTRA domain-containing protein [Minisyncoccia bacterium]